MRFDTRAIFHISYCFIFLCGLDGVMFSQVANIIYSKICMIESKKNVECKNDELFDIFSFFVIEKKNFRYKFYKVNILLFG